MSEEYSYIPPEEWFVNDQGLDEAIPKPEIPQPWTPTEAEQDYWSTWEHATGMTKKEINEQWQIQKEANRQWNLLNAHGVFYKGIYRHNP